MGLEDHKPILHFNIIYSDSTIFNEIDSNLVFKTSIAWPSNDLLRFLRLIPTINLRLGEKLFVVFFGWYYRVVINQFDSFITILFDILWDFLAYIKIITPSSLAFGFANRAASTMAASALTPRTKTDDGYEIRRTKLME